MNLTQTLEDLMDGLQYLTALEMADVRRVQEKLANREPLDYEDTDRIREIWERLY